MAGENREHHKRKLTPEEEKAKRHEAKRLKRRTHTHGGGGAADAEKQAHYKKHALKRLPRERAEGEGPRRNRVFISKEVVDESESSSGEEAGARPLGDEDEMMSARRPVPRAIGRWMWTLATANTSRRRRQQRQLQRRNSNRYSVTTRSKCAPNEFELAACDLRMRATRRRSASGRRHFGQRTGNCSLSADEDPQQTPNVAEEAGEEAAEEATEEPSEQAHAGEFPFS